MKRVIFVTCFFVILLSCLNFSSSLISGCNPDTSTCNTASCSPIFLSSSIGWNYNPLGQCENGDADYAISAQGSCAAGQHCAIYTDILSSFDQYQCPSYELNGNSLVTTGDCSCSDNGGGCVIDYSTLFNFSSEFFAGSGGGGDSTAPVAGGWCYDHGLNKFYEPDFNTGLCFTFTDNVNITNATLYVWNSTGGVVGTNFTNVTGNSTNLNLSVSLPSRGEYTWNYYVIDSSGNVGYNETNISLSYSWPNISLEWIYPTSDVNVTKDGWFNVSVNVSCLGSYCGEINVSLDPISGCDPSILSQTCTNSACNSLYRSSYSDWYWYDDMSYDYCTTSTNSSLQVLTDSYCDISVLGAGTGECATSEGTNYWLWLCPSYERNGNVRVTAEHCKCNGNNNCTISSEFNQTFNGDSVFFTGIEISSGETKSGLIPYNVTNATPFWTNVTNPYNLTLRTFESRIITWWVNASGTSDNTHQFFLFANLTENMSLTNVTSRINVTIVNASSGPNPLLLTDCGNLTIHGGYYNLTQDVSSAGTCFTVLNDSITLDGQGNKISFSQSTNGYGVDNLGGYTDLTVKNSKIYSGSSLSVISIGFTNAANGSVINNSLSAVGFLGTGIVLTSSNSTIIANNTINSTYGVSFSTNSMFNRLFNNNITTTNNGIVLASSNNSVYLNNITTTSNGNGIVLTSYFNSIRFNWINSTNGNSLVWQSPATNLNNSVIGNELIDNGKIQLNFGVTGINETYLINQNVLNYSFIGLGGKIIVENTSYGKIKFLEMVNGSGINLVGLGNSDIIFGNNSVYINSSRSSGLNKSANVTLYNIPSTFTNPVVLKDGNECSNCFNFTSLNAGTVIFNVTGWSNYSIGESSSDVTSPIVNLTSRNNTYISDSTIYLASNFSDNSALANATLYVWNSTFNLVNSTENRSIHGLTNNTNISFSLFSEGRYYWNYLVFDSSGNSAWGISNYTFVYDVTKPNVLINSPINTTYTSNNYNIDVGLDEPGICNYSLTSGTINVSLSVNSSNTGFTTSVSGASNGNYLLNAYCYDFAGNTNLTENVSFVISVSSSEGSSGSGSSTNTGGGSAGIDSTTTKETNKEIICNDDIISFDNCFNTQCSENGIRSRYCLEASTGCGNKISLRNYCNAGGSLVSCNDKLGEFYSVSSSSCQVEICASDWSCGEWSSCSNGVSTRSCNDLNSCSKSGDNSRIDSLSCEVKEILNENNEVVECNPAIVCGDWSECSYEAKAEDIFRGDISVTGSKSRECKDYNYCTSDYTEQSECLINTPINLTQIYDLDRCGEIILPGDYNLVKDLSSSGSCLKVLSEDVRINGNGYKISGKGVGNAIDVVSSGDGFTLTDIIIDGFENAVLMGGNGFNLNNIKILNSNNGLNLIRANNGFASNLDIRACSNYNGIWLQNSDRNKFENVFVYNCPRGFVLSGGSDENIFENSRALNYDEFGLVLNGADKNVFERFELEGIGTPKSVYISGNFSMNSFVDFKESSPFYNYMNGVHGLSIVNAKGNLSFEDSIFHGYLYNKDSEIYLKVMEDDAVKIEFLEPIGAHGLFLDSLVSRYISIKEDIFAIDWAKSSNGAFDKRFILTSVNNNYSTSEENLIIFRDGNICDSCEILKYSDSEIVFSSNLSGTYIFANRLNKNDSIYQEIKECGVLDKENGIYSLMNDIKTTNTCFSVRANNVTILGNGYKIDGDSNNDIQGVNIEDYSGLSVSGLKISNFSFGVYAKNSNDLHLYSNEFYGVYGSNGNGIGIYSSKNSLIENNDFYYNIDSKSKGDWAINIQSAFSNIINNKIYGYLDSKKYQNINYGIHIRANNISLVGNYIDGASLRAIDISGENSYIADNLINASNYGILVNSPNALLEKNSLIDSKFYDQSRNTKNYDNSVKYNQKINNWLVYLSSSGVFGNNLTIINPDFRDYSGSYRSALSVPSPRIFSNKLINEIATINFINLSSDVLKFSEIKNLRVDRYTLIDSDVINSYDFSDISNSLLSFEISGKGKIDYSNVINGQGTKLNEKINISDNYVSVDSSEDSSLDTLANVTIYGNYDGVNEVEILRDGNICDSCELLEIKSDYVKFKVNGFSSYSINVTSKVGSEQNSDEQNQAPSEDSSSDNSQDSSEQDSQEDTGEGVGNDYLQEPPSEESTNDQDNSNVPENSNNENQQQNANSENSQQASSSSGGGGGGGAGGATSERIAAKDSITGNTVAIIDKTSWKENQEFNVKFVQSDEQIIQYCSNGVLDSDRGEDGIDCGGKCGVCKKPSRLNSNSIFKWIFWVLLGAVLFVGVWLGYLIGIERRFFGDKRKILEKIKSQLR